VTLSSKGTIFICKFEGFKPKPYKDENGIWTIGYGTTYYPDDTRVQETDKAISTDMARIYLTHHINKSVVPSIISLSIPFSQTQFDALASFIYNIGMGHFEASSLLISMKNRASNDIITTNFKKWNKAGGKILPGLTTRRTAEANLYCNGIY